MMNELKELDLFLNNMTQKDRDYALANHFAYFFSKARLFLKIGPKKYRMLDFFEQPSDKNSVEELEVLTLGCTQIMEGRGFSEERPFVNLDVFGFSLLMSMFHFERDSRTSKYGVEIEGKTGVLDCITVIHQVDGKKATLFNFCAF
jgi:hypothetical protein